MKPWQALAAVLSAFAGIRKGEAARQDKRLGFAEIVTAAIVLAGVLVLLLVLLVRQLAS